MLSLSVKTPEIYAVCVDKVERYIGKTVGPLKRRLQQHLNKAKNGANTHLAALLRAALRDEKEITIVWVDEVKIVEEWGPVEAAYIQHYREEGYDLVNLTQGGEGVGSGPDNFWYQKKRGPQSPEHREAWRIANIGKHEGREWTLEEREAISKKLQGRKHTPERIEKMRRSKQGKKLKPRSLEHCAALSKALTGQTTPLATREKQRQAALNRTPEQREKLQRAQAAARAKKKESS